MELWIYKTDQKNKPQFMGPKDVSDAARRSAIAVSETVIAWLLVDRLKTLNAPTPEAAAYNHASDSQYWRASTKWATPRVSAMGQATFWMRWCVRADKCTRSIAL